MICPKCEKEIPEDSGSCPECGAELADAEEVAEPPVREPDEPSPDADDGGAAAERKRRVVKTALVVGGAVVAVLLAAAVGVGVWRASQNRTFEQAVAAADLDEALRMADLIQHRYGPAAGFLEDYERAEENQDAADEARKAAEDADAEQDAAELWAKAEGLVESGAEAFAKASPGDAADLWEQSVAMFAKAVAWAKGARAERAARAAYTELLLGEADRLRDPARKAAAEADPGKESGREAAKELYAVLDELGGAKWLQNKAAVEQARKLADEARWLEAVRKWEEAKSTLTAAAKLAEKPAWDRQYQSAMTRGREAMRARTWDEAVAAFTHAMRVPGYEKDERAAVRLKRARSDKALADAQAAAERGDWRGVYEHAKALLALDPTSITAKQFCDTAYRKLHLELTVLTTADMREAKGATVAINGEVREEKTPATFELERGHEYSFTVTLPPRVGKVYLPVEKNYPVAKSGSATLRLNFPSIPVPVRGREWAVPDLGMEFVWVAALKHWVGKYEVTNGEYRRFRPSHDSGDYKGRVLNDDRQPVVNIAGRDAVAFAKWLTDREGEAHRLPEGFLYRLPYKREWLIYVQCGEERKYPWGISWPPTYGNYSDQASAWRIRIDRYVDAYPVTCPVEKSGRNDWGLYGVGGNVWELTTRRSGAPAAWRGGAWRGEWFIDKLKCEYDYFPASTPSDDCGFRLMLLCPPE